MEFQLRAAVPSDLPGILSVMRAAQQALVCQDWFVPDEEAYFAAHINGPEGFCHVAEAPDGQLAAYFTVKLAGEAEDALGRRLDMTGAALRACAQMDSCCVAPPYRGHSLEGRLLELAERRLLAWPGQPYTHCLGTVHPDNAASLYSFLHRGYRIAAADVLCYGGKRRHILQKDL